MRASRIDFYCIFKQISLIAVCKLLAMVVCKVSADFYDCGYANLRL